MKRLRKLEGSDRCQYTLVEKNAVLRVLFLSKVPCFIGNISFFEKKEEEKPAFLAEKVNGEKLDAWDQQSSSDDDDGGY